jgi:hypothetical protein
MIKGVTGSGFAYEVKDEALDDYELLETLAAIDNGDSGRIPQMVNLLLGEEQKELLKEHCRVDGRISSARMLSEVSEILTSNNAGKN